MENFPDTRSAEITTSPELRLGHHSVVWSLSGPFQAVRTVDIERMPSGTIVVAWRAEPESSRHVDMGDILCAVSNDEGRTWSAPISIASADEQWACGNVVLFVHESRLYAFIGRCPAQEPHSEKQTIFCRISDDDGRTWCDSDIDVLYDHPTIGGGKVVQFGGRFFMPFHRNDSERVHGVLVSEDLKVWSLAGVVPQSGDVFLQEGFLVPSTDGSARELLLVMREGDWKKLGDNGNARVVVITRDGCVQVSRSQDGLSWSSIAPWPDVPNHNVKGVLLKDSVGRFVAFYNDAPDRERLFVKAGDRGNWSDPLQLPGGDGWNCYTMAVEAVPSIGRQTRILAAYESGKGVILFQEIFIEG